MTPTHKDMVIQMNIISGGLNLMSYELCIVDGVIGKTSDGGGTDSTALAPPPSTSFVVVKNNANKHKMKKFIFL